jgi:23S rRNA (guanosine2251-2'-O)-methyltransferase
MRTLRSKTGVRKLHKESVGRLKRPVELAFLLQDWNDPYNVGGMYRVADACGAAEIVLSGKTPAPPDPQISVTSLGHHRRVKTRSFARSDEAARALRGEGYTLMAVEITDEATCYTDFEYPEKLCLVLGNEVNGVYTSVLAECDAAVFIPMAGKGRSINVHVAAAVVAFHVLFGGNH